MAGYRIKLVEENITEDCCDLGLGKNFLDIAPKPWFIKKFEKSYQFKIKIFTLQTHTHTHLLGKKKTDESQTRRKYLQIICLIKDLYLTQ